MTDELQTRKGKPFSRYEKTVLVIIALSLMLVILSFPFHWSEIMAFSAGTFLFSLVTLGGRILVNRL